MAILNFVVRVTGPELLSAEGREVFARIEESIRQYGTHTRETIYLVRRPMALARDHFAILWSHGAAVVGLYERGGTLRGGRRGPWTLGEAVGDRHREISFENIYQQLLSAREGLERQIRSITIGAAALATSEVVDDLLENVTAPQLLSAETENASLSAIALFARPLTEIHIPEVGADTSFTVMSLDDATTRTMFHMPNLLRVIDRQSVVYSNSDLRIIAESMERSTLLRTDSTPFAEAATSEEEAPSMRRSALAWQRSASAGSKRWWIVLILVILAVIIFYVARTLTAPPVPINPIATPPVPAPPASHPPSEMVVELPGEIQLFVSPTIYLTRSELDRALAQGLGQRYLPGAEQILVLDSLTFAKGVYGYFKVDNAWRKGKLLQTFQSHDTIKIDNFLPPLPSAP